MAITPIYNPKFFSYELTGNGGSRGKLCQNVNPINLIIPGSTGTINVISNMLDTTKQSYSTIGMKTTTTPFFIVPASVWERVDSIAPNRVVSSAHAFAKASGAELYIALEPHSLIMRHMNATETDPSYNTFSVAYRLTFMRASDRSKAVPTTAFRTPPLPNVADMPYLASKETTQVAHALMQGDCLVNVFCLDPVSQTIAVANALAAAGEEVYAEELNNFLQNYSLYEGICKRAYAWREKAAHEFGIVCEFGSKSDVLQTISALAAYNVSLDQYKTIYNSICKYYDKADLHLLCRENINLFLFDDMRKVEENLSSMRIFNSPDDPCIPTSLTDEQRYAVRAKGPFTIVEATAGSGKTHTIVERVRHMIRSGISAEEITAVSFTNAAADNLAKRADADISTSTIARMIHDIYTLNFPKHTLATAGTLANSLDAFYPTSPNAATLGKLLRAASRNDSLSMAKLNVFIEDNRAEVINMLNTARQTTLEVEIILAYQLVDSLEEPDGPSREYIILDEVQDTSVFEFAYLMRYAVLHRSNVFLVGDAAQCLFEFRGADPRAMNVFESSPAFETCKLQVNFRSNPGILDFANELLCDIEANQKANLRLIPHIPRTKENDTQACVNYCTRRIKAVKDKKIEMPKGFNETALPFINECLDKHEQVAILTFTRDDSNLLRTLCEDKYFPWMEPGRDTVSLIPETVHETNVLSKYVAYKATDVRFLQSDETSFADTVKENVLSQLEDLTSSVDRVKDSVIRQLDRWKESNTCALSLAYSNWKQGSVDDAHLVSVVQESLLGAEIDHNNMSRHVITNLNDEEEQQIAAQNALLVFSTIHSAKGLEFDNVVVVLEDDADMSEEKKRLYYVALTRAKKRECIIALEPQSAFPIQERYTKAVQNNATTN